jgi:uncharacterized cupin superfamily protein
MNMYLDHTLGVRLEEIGPKPGATAGSPVESALEISDDGRVATGIWECTPGEFPSEKKGISEFMVFLSGRGTITDEDGVAHEIGPGVAMWFPDGWRGAWQIRETIRKAYTIITT